MAVMATAPGVPGAGGGTAAPPTSSSTAAAPMTMRRAYKFIEGYLAYESFGRQALIAWYLGALFGAGAILSMTSASLRQFGLFLVFLGVYHMWEYQYIAMFRRRELSSHSFLIWHSTEFVYALALGFAEYWVEYFLFPSLNGFGFVPFVGVLLVLMGQCMRTVSMFTAGHNFNHAIETEKRDDHKLVTSGIYAYFRHPSYFGWFWWAVGTQVLLYNPLSLVMYTAAAWYFFHSRIAYEERQLVHIFGDDYVAYKKATKTFIPFIP